jgi:Bacterial pre-peptidase C-terminal domain
VLFFTFKSTAGSLQSGRSRAAWVHEPLALLVGCLLISAYFCFRLTAYGFEEDRPEPTKGPEVASRQPQLNAVFPMAAHPGARLRLEVQGEFLDGVSQVRFEGEDITGKVITSTFTAAQIEISISSSSIPGPRPFRLVSPRGVSNTVLFRVSLWPTPTEVEPNDELDSPMQIQTPVLLSGRLQSGEDVDLYHFHAMAGQRLQFNVLGARNGTPADVSLAILYPDGRELVHDEGRFIWDPYLDHTFEKGGDYLAAVTLTRMPAGGQSRTDLNYQLGIGQSPFLWSVFPMGGRPGTTLEVTLRADFVEPKMALNFRRAAAQASGNDGVPLISGEILERCSTGEFRLAVRIDPKAEPGVYEFSVKDDSGTLAPMKFLVSGLPEIRENEPNSDQARAEALQVPVTVNGRIDRDGDEDWFRISVAAGTSLVVSVDAEKYGSVFDSFLTLLDAKGKLLASNDDVKWTNRPLNRDAQIGFTFQEAGDHWINVSSLYRRGGPDHVYRVTVEQQQPDFLVSLKSDRATVPRGGTGKVAVTLRRLGDFKGDVSVEAAGLPSGATAKGLTLEKEKESGSLEFEGAADCPLGLTEIKVSGVAKIDGREVRRRAALPPERFQGSGPAFDDSSPSGPFLAVVEPPQFALESAASTVYLVRGGTSEFGVRVTRRPDFRQPLTLAAENLPPGVSIEGIELIDEGRMARVTLRAAAEAVPVRVPNLAIIGSAEQSGRKFSAAAPRISLQLD